MRSVAREVIKDIDKLDGGNHLAAVDYVEDIYRFYKVAEVINFNSMTDFRQNHGICLSLKVVFPVVLQNECRPRDYMYSQLDFNSEMRGILVDYLIEVHEELDLVPETLYLAVYIIDRHLSLQPILRKKLQLVGVTALLIACKYEETRAPKVDRIEGLLLHLLFYSFSFKSPLNALAGQ
jgi:cyclin B